MIGGPCVGLPCRDAMGLEGLGGMATRDLVMWASLTLSHRGKECAVEEISLSSLILLSLLYTRCQYTRNRL